jgi:hypothetical protein
VGLLPHTTAVEFSLILTFAAFGGNSWYRNKSPHSALFKVLTLSNALLTIAMEVIDQGMWQGKFHGTPMATRFWEG